MFATCANSVVVKRKKAPDVVQETVCVETLHDPNPETLLTSILQLLAAQGELVAPENLVVPQVDPRIEPSPILQTAHLVELSESQRNKPHRILSSTLMLLVILFHHQCPHERAQRPRVGTEVDQEILVSLVNIRPKEGSPDLVQ